MQSFLDEYNFKISKTPWSEALRLCAPVLKTVAKTSLSFYRAVLSPHVGGACRFEPSCSLYAFEAFETHNFITATKLTAIRLSKCHPFGSFGFDPVPTSEDVQK